VECSSQGFREEGWAERSISSPREIAVAMRMQCSRWKVDFLASASRVSPKVDPKWRTGSRSFGELSCLLWFTGIEANLVSSSARGTSLQYSIKETIGQLQTIDKEKMNKKALNDHICERLCE
jgi:hypothetical protein